MRKSKKNGFSLPLHPFQFITYLIILYEIVGASTVVVPVLDSPLQVPSIQTVFLVIYSPLQVAVVILGYWATKSDPTDPVVYAHRQAIERK
jgi:hypothetical protein